MSVPFFMHDLGEAELANIAEVLKGPILTTGEWVTRFESEFAAYLRVPHALGTNSCTGALHMVLLALGIGPGDEVITTPMTFIATAAAIQEAGARPVFVDVEADSGNLDAEQVEAAITPRTRAILPVHLYGLMCDMRQLRKIADQHGLALIEDAAHCIEGERDGVRPGQLGDAACFSFFATKNMTCGEGGAVVCRDGTLYEPLKKLRLHGMTKTASDRYREGYQHWDMTMLGWKYNMDNIQAAMLLPQMQRLETNRMRRERIAERYCQQLAKIPGVVLPAKRPNSRHAHHLFPIRVEPAYRDSLVAHLQSHDIGTTVNYRAIHLLSHFQGTLGHRQGSYPVAEQIGDETLSLPLYPTMPLENVDRVTEALKVFFS
jgi:UDP-4-amino-4-deoxy-L-arabinose-oxoglutarate aminotransferase